MQGSVKGATSKEGLLKGEKFSHCAPEVSLTGLCWGIFI